MGTIYVDCRGLSPLGSSAFLWIYIPLGFIARTDGSVRIYMVSSWQIPLVYVTDPVPPDYCWSVITTVPHDYGWLYRLGICRIGRCFRLPTGDGSHRAHSKSTKFQDGVSSCPTPALGESRRQWTCVMTEGAKPFKEHLHQKLTKDAIAERNGHTVILSVTPLGSWLTQTVAVCPSGGVILSTPVAYLS